VCEVAIVYEQYDRLVGSLLVTFGVDLEDVEDCKQDFYLRWLEVYAFGFDAAKGSLRKVINSILFKRSLAYRKRCCFDIIRKAIRGFEGCNEEDLVDRSNPFDSDLEGAVKEAVEQLTLNGGNGNGGRRKDFSAVFEMMRNGSKQREIAGTIGYSMGATNRMVQSIEKVVVGFAEN
jgi:hypothetical protein